MTKVARQPTRSNPRHDTEPPANVLVRAAIVAAVIGALIYLAATVYSGVPLRDYRNVDAIVPNPGSLIPHDPVRIGGVRVGQITGIDSTRGGDAVLRLQINPGHELTEGTQIVLRANGLLGARFVELVPGKSDEPLPEGAVLRGGADSLTFGATDALDVLDAKTRAALRPMLGELGTALLGQGTNVNDLLRVGGAAITPSADLFAQLNTAPEANDRLLPGLNAMMAPLDDRRVQIARLFGVTADAFAPIPEHRAATQATLDEAPGALAAADSALGETRTLLRSVRTFAQEAHRTLPLAPAGLRELRALLDEAPAPLDRANKLLAAAKPAVPGALAITTALAPVLRPAKQLLDRVRPMLDTIAPHQCDIENFGAVFRDMTGYGSNAPGGPGGPPGEFRLQAVTPTGFENLGLSDPTGLTRREGYATPCQYLSEPYPILPSPGSLLGGLK